MKQSKNRMLLCVSCLLFIISLQYTRCTDQLSVAMEVDGSGFTFHENVSNAEDFTNYFQEYGTIYEQKRMLEDEIRMNSYHEAIMGNAEYFSGKTVLDVGAGTGVLSMWVCVSLTYISLSCVFHVPISNICFTYS